jgi:hypothetical protein
MSSTIVRLQVFGAIEPCLVFAVHPARTIDFERLSDGRCFRMSGLSQETWDQIREQIENGDSGTDQGDPDDLRMILD